MDPYSYQGSEPNFNLRWKEITKKWSSRLVDFPSAFPNSHWGSNIVRGEYFRSWHRGSVPLAILLHGMGDHSVIPCRLLARSLASNGVACLILYLVVHSSRMPLVMRRQFPHLTSEEWFQVYQASVIEVRQVIDWASSRHEIEGEKLAVVGISFGGFISAIAMGIDQRIGAGVFIISGGNSEKISYMSGLSTITRDYQRTEAEYQRLQRYYFQYLAEVAKKGLENVNPLRKSYLTDPMTFAHRLRQRPVLMINARWDEAISAEATLDFWQECGRPDIVWLPATHATIWLWYPLIRRKIAGFLRASFEKREKYRQYLSGGGA